MTNVAYGVKGSFIYNDELKDICVKVVTLSKKLYKYRKRYMKYAKHVELEQAEKGIININKDKSIKIFSNNKNIKNISNLSFYNLIRQYDELVKHLLYLCNNNIDIYIEFLYILIINNDIFNYFLYLCTFISGDKYDPFILLIHKHFTILIKYYYYSSSYNYYNHLYTKLKDIYDAPRSGLTADNGTRNATGSASDGNFLDECLSKPDENTNYKEKKEKQKKCNDITNSYTSSEDSLSNVKKNIKNEIKKVGTTIHDNQIKNKSIDTNNSDDIKKSNINKHDIFNINKKYFNIKNYLKLKKIMLMFEKITNEHIYILLYFSLSILPTLFHTYLTIRFAKNNKHANINSCLIYILRQIKLKTKKNYLNKFTNPNDNLLYTLKRENEHTNIISDFIISPIDTTHKFKSNIKNYYENYSDCLLGEIKKSNDILWNSINNINVNAQVEQVSQLKRDDQYEQCENYAYAMKKKMQMLHTLDLQADMAISQSEEKEKKESKQNKVNVSTSKRQQTQADKQKKIRKKKKKTENNMDREKEKSMKILEKLLKENMKINYIYKYVKTKKYIINCEGFENVIKNVSTIIQYNIYSFFINNIELSNSGGKNSLIVDNPISYGENINCNNKTRLENNCYVSKMFCETYENNNYIVVHRLKKDNTLIHNEYIKKKIKKNEIYTYKMLNNKIESLLTTKEFMENIKKQKQNKKKGNKHEKDIKNKLDFFYIGTENNNDDDNIINNQNNIYNDIYKYFKKNNNTDIYESDVDSYKDSDSSDNLIFYDNSKKYFYQNKLNIDYFTYFIINSFYIFIHFHNLYFSSTYYNIFLTFSIKLAYKYTHGLHQTTYTSPSNSLYREIGTSPLRPIGVLLGDRPRKISRNKKAFYRKVKEDEIESETSPVVKIVMNSYLQKYQNIKKKKKKKWNKFGYNKNDDDFLNKKSLSNTFEIIVNTFLDLCISICSIDFKSINTKHNVLNKKYILNHIYYYNQIINKNYDAVELYNHDLQNYNNCINGYLLYFSELKKNKLFKNTFINNKHVQNDINELNGCSLKERNRVNADKDKTTKQFKEKQFIYDQKWKDNEHDLSSDNCNTLSSNYSDKSLLFLKKCKSKINKRIYIDENNVINLLMNIGCLFMNNIKYNARFVFNILDKMRENKDISKNKNKFFNYMHTVFFSPYNNPNPEKIEKKNSLFLNIYNQYLLSFFFFFKIHYIFFLIKFKCEKELYIRSYWLLYAVYNITQEF
ncbi:conserved Plasmodium protein, unknown function [Plasmodium vinckei brucechwatti]|uniref:Uncharacterized protein n=1 Tax=Plasmodium vinckei brucechwatti TaxID=119398 RepID=A0A6V7S262_PLAVN|nr:conserved Plasmodium protein, unknown function [Plasmodium vinckei brucechwatti]